MSSNENSVSMAERLAEWRRQRDSQQQTVKPAVLSQGQQTQGTLGQKIRSKEKTVLGAAGGGVVGGGALSNKLRVNNSVPKESSKPVAPNASLAPTTFKRSLSQSQPQEPLSTVHQQVQKRTKVVFDLPDHPLQTSIHENINNINATLPSQGPTPISFPINTNFTAKPKPHQTNSSATTVPAAAPPPPHPSSESHETLMTRTTMLSLANKALQDQIAIDAKTRQTLQTQLTSTKQALHHAQTQNETCNQQYTRDLTSLTSLVSAKEAQIKTLLDSVSCFETQVRAQEAQLVGLDKECGVLQDQVHNLEERNRVLLVECEQARENFSNQEIVIQAQHEQKALWDLEKKGLQLTVGQVKEVVEHQRHRISELTLRLAEAEQKVVVGEESLHHPRRSRIAPL
ncbi:hypothetical protein BDR26DRAFT_727579 [Obelidium mucronatum]|nr:hypothetical protein BDR26DRAFT_727579 [Obelidium mucronatum]